MKLYDFTLAPNPRRVRMFLAEKGIEVPSVQVNTREREQFSDDFKKVNPSSMVPVLELDDGTCISESVAICRYFEVLHPEPSLMGTDAKSQAIIEMWNRRVELQAYTAAADVVRNSAPMFEDRGLSGVPGGVPQIPALVERGKKTMTRFFTMLDGQLGDNTFVAGHTFTIADITAFVTIEFAKRGEIEIPESAGNVKRWHVDMGNRPSASA